MVPLLSELWRFLLYVMQPEHSDNQGLDAPHAASPLAGFAKAVLWVGLSLLAGFSLAQLGG